jgi:alginate O-acetyltransferase complex protein AlgI
MLFSTPFFLFVFLPLFLALYRLLPWRRWALLLGSMLFYGWTEPVFLWVVLASSLLDWGLGRALAAGGRRARGCLVAGILANGGLLVYAKYAGFGIENLNRILGVIGWDTFPVPHILLPLGISFIVFEKITYLVDVYRKVTAPAESLLDYLNYVFLFPKLLAGPIVKYHDINRQLIRPQPGYEDVRDGLIRFVQGLAKKVFLANGLAPVADGAFGLPAESLDPTTAWLGVLCFALQIYFDFSGYSDMAIGLARVLGFRLMENFRNPYLATSFTDFWRRWHISLSTWIKEYLYIPLGGSRVSAARAYANLVLCFLLSGLWHGAAWHFVLWGCVHGLMLVLDRAFWLECSRKLPAAANILLTFFQVALSWVLFRCGGLGQAVVYFKALSGTPATLFHEVFLYPHQLALLAIGAFLILRPLFREEEKAWGTDGPRPWALAWSSLLLVLCAAQMATSTLKPFLYFRF